MTLKNKLTQLLNIDFPLIMAPMFLVSNEAMMKSGMENGIMATFPTLNYRREGELEQVLDTLNNFKKDKSGNYGVNLIVQKTNPLFQKHHKICVDKKVPFYITSLGSPKEVIDAAHSYGAKVFCDITTIKHAEKAAQCNCDGFIAVGQGAGGHAGPNPLQVLIPSLHKHFPSLPVIAAGGIADGRGMLSALALGAQGVSVGTRFIACEEATVSKEYKDSIVKSGMDDIVMTTRLSGTPCAIINTPYAKKIGLEQSGIEKFLSNNSTTKKWFKMLVQIRGMQKLEKSVKPGNYQTLWTAGKSAELIDDIKSCRAIIAGFKLSLDEAYLELQSNMQ